jgi:preprotein translocase subunit SecB
MADDVLTPIDLDAPQANGADNEPSAAILMQYVKDLSVENPNAPECYQWADAPQIDVQFNIGARDISEEITEIELKISLSSKAPQGTAFMVELAYCGLVGIRNVEDAQKHAFTYAEAPRILFPVARRVIADAVRDAGFPPLMLEPIDFQGIYLQQLQARDAQSEAGSGADIDAPIGNA